MALSVKDAANAMVEEFISSWAGQTAVLLENQNETPPGADLPWVRVSVAHDDGRWGAVGGQPGNRLFKRSGRFIVNVFVPKGTATNQLDDLSYDALLVFEGRTLGAISFENSRITAVPISTDWKFAQADVIHNFSYDDIH